MILSIDQGTTGTTCLVVDDELRVRGRGYREVPQHFPQPGWVEHDPEEIWVSVVGAAEDAVRTAGIRSSDLRVIGIANQRETTVLWERASGTPVAPAIVWQDRRTAARCGELDADLIRARTGLVPDPYFSATKLEWLLARTDVPRDGLAFGTVDSWLVWKLTGGRAHVTDLTNASRTMLLDLDSLDWSDELLDLFGVGRALLPRLVRSAEVVGEAELLGVTVPVAGIAGDQQAALFGHGCFGHGQAKATYGTGSFVLAHAGPERGSVPAGLLETVAASGGYALEGAILASGAAIQWLRDGLGILADAAESERLARSVDSTGGVSFVPAFAGLGSPHWNARRPRADQRDHPRHDPGAARPSHARGDRLPGRRRARRASRRRRRPPRRRRCERQRLPDAVPGRPARLSGWRWPRSRRRPALGAAALAGRAIGLWPDDDAIRGLLEPGAVYEPAADRESFAARREEWRRALDRALL